MKTNHLVLCIAPIILFCFGAWNPYAEAGGDWSHPYGGVDARAFFELPSLNRNIQALFDFQTMPIPFALGELRCADLDGDGYQEAVGLSKDRRKILIVDFMEGRSYEVPLAVSDSESMGLSALVDLDQDQIKDVLFSVTASGGGAMHYGYSAAKNDFLFSLAGANQIENEQAFTALDMDFDGNLELISVGQIKDSPMSAIAVYSIPSLQLLHIHEIPGLVSSSNLALIADDKIEETRIFFASDASDSSSAELYAYVWSSKDKALEYLWSERFSPNVNPARMAIGRSYLADETVVVGTQSRTEDEPVVNSVSELDSYSGRMLQQVVIGPADCLDLSVGQLDQDDEYEIVFLDGDSNLHRIDFSLNRNRIMTIQNAAFYVGSAEMIEYNYPENENLAVQTIGNRILINFLSQDLDPVTAQNTFSVRGELAGRPILGDVDGNGFGEVLYVLGGDALTINRVFFYDPDQQNPIPTLTPTPDQIPTPTATPTPPASGINHWEIF